ncbi:MAG TPA: hypothetical protein VG406_16795 [Isosphaeraceae bacterium]|jgi:hypothetical protein|nr:hypothetical protein [Isosphaeraceae bacterium]
MATIAGMKVPPCRDEAEAEREFHELMATRAVAPESPKARVADVIEAFLAWSSLHVGEETHKQYLFFGPKLAEECGRLPVHAFERLDRIQRPAARLPLLLVGGGGRRAGEGPAGGHEAAAVSGVLRVHPRRPGPREGPAGGDDRTADLTTLQPVMSQ